MTAPKTPMEELDAELVTQVQNKPAINRAALWQTMKDIFKVTDAELTGLAAGTHVVVPIVPNEAMLRNALPYLCHSYARQLWKSMIEEATKP